MRHVRTVLLAALAGLPIQHAGAQTLQWTRQIGTPGSDRASDAAAASAGGGGGAGGVFIAGATEGGLGGPGAGGQDAFLARYTAAGALLWTRQIGTPQWDEAIGVAVDGAGGVFIAGDTKGSLGGPNPAPGIEDAFLAKYDAAGSLLWTRQLGTPGIDIGFDAAADSAGNAFIAGWTAGSLGGPSAGGVDAFIAKYDATGALLWMRQLGTASTDHAQGVAADDAGNAFIAGYTGGSFAGQSVMPSDAFVAKYDASGALLWVRQIVSWGTERAEGVAADGAGGVYICGHTSGSIGGPDLGGDDAFVARYDGSGALLWIRQFGTARYDYAWAVAADAAGNAYITGYTDGDFAGQSGGADDAFLVKFDAQGSMLWARQLGVQGSDFGCGVAVDAAGAAYITGACAGSLGGPSAGGGDIFLARYEPTLCYANCDGSTAPPILNVNDFYCFINHFGAGSPVANCDGSTIPPVLNVNDYICFQTQFAAGCP